MKKKIGIAILILILIAGILVGLIYFSPTGKAGRNLTYIKDAEKMEEDTKLPEKMYLLVANYEGELSTRTIFKSYYHLVANVLPKYYQDCKQSSIEEISTYFEKNEKVIYMETGIQVAGEFQQLISLLSGLNGEKLQLESYRIDSDNLQKQEKGLQVAIYVTYQGNQAISIKTILENQQNKDRTSLLVKAN